MSAPLHVSDPGTHWTVADPRELALRIRLRAVSAALAGASARAGQPAVLVCRTSTRHGLDCLPPDADGHFIKLPPSLVAAAVSELTGKL